MPLFRRDRGAAAEHPALLLAGRVRTGELSMVDAITAAREEGGRNGAALVGDVSEAAKVMAHRGQPREGLVLVRIAAELLEGARARMSADGFADLAIWVFGDYVDTVTAVLREHADVVLYAAAVQHGEEATRLAAVRGRPDLEGMIFHRLGALHLDVYGNFGGTREQYWARYREWQARLHLSDDFSAVFAAGGRFDRGEDGTLRRIPPPQEMPDPRRALEHAVTYFTRAGELRPEQWRGRSLKGRAQALYVQWFLGLAPVEVADVEQAGRDALRHLPTDADDDRLYVLNMLEHLGDGPDPDPAVAGELARSLLDGGLADLVRRDGPARAWDTLAHAARALRKDDPATALRLLQSQGTLTGPWVDEQRRIDHLERLFDLVTVVHGPAWLPHAEVDQATYSRVRDDPSLDPAERGYGLLYLARQAGLAEQETLAQLLVEQALPLLWQAPREFGDALSYLRAGLHVGEAVNAINDREPVDAADQYSVAIEYLLDIDLPEAALALLGRIESIILDVPDQPGQFIPPLARVALRIEDAAGVAATRRLQTIYRYLAALMFHRGTSAPAMLLLVQIAKGARRSRLLRDALPPLSIQPPDPAWLPREPQELLQGQGDTDTHLLAYAGSREQRPTGSPAEQAANLRARYSSDVWHALLTPPGAEPAPDATPDLVMPDDLRAALDPQTVLLAHWPAMSVDLDQVIVTVLVTNETIDMVVRKDEIPAGTYAMEDQGRTVMFPPEALLLGNLRELLQRDPRPRHVRHDCVEPLANLREDLFQPLVADLDALVAAGKRHILIAPYGPYRFFPLHLAGPYDHPICAEFTVTYLSDLGALGRPAATRRRTADLAAFGLSYDDRDDLPALAHTDTEVRAVAEAFGAPVHLDAAATKRAVFDAFESVRMVHLRAHGRHDIDAPMLQTVYLTPDTTDDGRLFAYEVLGLDLSGLELVTLSACETGLGRYDEGDNVAGLAANLLLNGCQRVVSTLWPAAERATTAFFPSLYTHLRAGVAPRDAFAAAQRETRSLFPQYRDWGTFVMYES